MSRTVRAAPATAVLAAACLVAVAAAGLVAPPRAHGWTASPGQTPGRPAVAATPTAPGSGLAAHLDRLPIVLLDLPTSADRRAAAAYRRATILDPWPLADAYDATWEALSFAPGGAEAIADLRFGLSDVELDPDEFDTRIDAALSALREDPANGQRLGNAAILLWLLALALDADPGNDDGLPDPWLLQSPVIALLEAANEEFPGRREVLLNLAHLRTLTGVAGNQDGAAYAEAALALDPGDLTARALVASIRARDPDPSGIDRALEILRPMREDPDLAALGEALAGDAHLAAGTTRRGEAPAAALMYASLALTAYERAQQRGADPGLEAGRARAFELRGEPLAAAEAMAHAVELAPDALDFLVERARMLHVGGDVASMGVAAETAVQRVIAGWDPPIEVLRLVASPGDLPILGDRGFHGWSIGSAADHLPVRPEPLGSGGGVVTVELIPRVDAPGLDDDLTTTPGPRAAWRLALDHAIIGGDPDAAAILGAAWSRHLPWARRWDDRIAAAGLVAERPSATPPVGEAIEVAVPLQLAHTALRRAARFAEAATLCRAWGNLRCAGESAFHAGDAAHAARDLASAVDAAESGDFGADPALRLAAAAAAEAAGDTETAAIAFAGIAGDTGTGARASVLAALRLGDLRLRDEDPGGAAAWYDLAEAVIEANDIAGPDASTGVALEARGLLQVARNNRAVARLRSLQRDADTPPDCSPGAAMERCEAALEDVRAAIASDPGNGAYRMTEGWAARLLGDAETARAALEEAIRLDPGLYPAFNDLGVLLAGDGDDAGARRAFEAALVAAPDYDLATWNLGILDLRDVPGRIADGQRRLAAVIRRDPELRTAPLSFRTDERTYTFGFEGPPPPAAGAAPGRVFSVGAVVLGAGASLAALAQLQSVVVGHAVGATSEGLTGWLERQGRRAGWRRRQRRVRRALPRPFGREWLPWSTTAVVVLAVTAWQAAQASPATAGAAIALTLAALVLAFVAHAVGHLFAARVLGGRILPATWAPGAFVALVFLPLQAASGPFPAERLRLARGGDRGASAFHLAGPAANAIVAVAAYAMFMLEPLPALRLLSQVQVAVIAYALLPVRPLDGWSLRRDRPWLLAGLGLAVVVAGGAFALGIL